jgi:Glycosyltransferase family 87
MARSATSERTTEQSARPGVAVRRPTALSGLATVLLWSACILVTVGLIYNNRDHHSFGKDSHAYWLTIRHAHLYSIAPGKQDAYLYSPAFAVAIWPLAKLPWLAFMWCWATIEGACFFWLLRPLPARWSIPLLMICAMESITGDIYGMLGVVAVLGLSQPGLWAFPLLTKIVPGLGVGWFAVRGEWRKVAEALGVTAAIALTSFALVPHLWTQWLHFLFDHRGRSTLLFPVRLPIGVAALVYGARTNRRWLLPVAMMLALPMAANLWTITMLAPIVRLTTTHRSPLQRSEVTS